MTITKAVELLKVLLLDLDSDEDPDTKDAILLGIEALKRYKAHRVLFADYDFDLLPGETPLEVT